MFSRIRKRFTFVNVMMTLALVFAMTGGAYAAKKYLITSTKQISPKVLKQLKGKNGKNGAPGATGAQGPQGPAGVAGKDGANGKDGASVTGPEGPEGKEGKEGSPWTAGGKLPSEKSETGSWIVRTNTEEDNGQSQTAISFPIPLKSALVETQVHYIAGEAAEGEGELTSGSTTIHKVEPKSGQFMAGQEISGTGIPAGTLIKAYNQSEETITLSANATASGSNVQLNSAPPASETEKCPGRASSPTATKGNLCVYAIEEKNFAPAAVFRPGFVFTINPPTATGPVGPATTGGSGTTGALLSLGSTTAGTAERYAYGTWAVTAP